MALAFRKIPAVPGIVIGNHRPGILGAIFQGNTFGSLLSAAYGGYTSNSGVEAVDNLLTKGGFESMMYTVSLVICAMMFGGIMEKTNQLRVVVTVILKKAQIQRVVDYGHHPDRHRIQSDPVRSVHVHRHDRQDVRPILP
jgi:NhaC family Na+:H+ antiporter